MKNLEVDNMAIHPNYWKFKRTIKELKEKNNRCFICGSSENIVPHHLKKVKQTSDDYYNKNNIILLCDDHHREYHHKYPQVNSKTFCEYMRNWLIKEYNNYDEIEFNKLKKENKAIKKVNNKLRNHLKKITY